MNISFYIFNQPEISDARSNRVKRLFSLLFAITLPGIVLNPQLTRDKTTFIHDDIYIFKTGVCV